MLRNFEGIRGLVRDRRVLKRDSRCNVEWGMEKEWGEMSCFISMLFCLEFSMMVFST
jgi:hypothetical protein